MTTIRVNEEDLRAVQALLLGLEDEAPKVLARSINASIRNSRTFSVKEIGKRYNLKAARIKRDFFEKKASYNKLSGKLSASGNQIGLAQFSASQKRSGVSVKVQKRGGRKIVKHTFLKQARNAKHVFGREWSTPRSLGGEGHTPKTKTNINYAALPADYRFPLIRRVGPSVPAMMSHGSILPRVEENAAMQHMARWSSNFLLLRLPLQPSQIPPGIIRLLSMPRRTSCRKGRIMSMIFRICRLCSPMASSMAGNSHRARQMTLCGFPPLGAI